MKNLKKLSGILLAIAVLLACTVTAFAAGVGTTGSITVDNPISGQTYTAYKIFDVSYTDGGSATYAYTISENSKWYSTVNTYATDPDNGLTLTESAIGSATKIYNVTFTESGTNAFSAAAFAKYLKDAGIPSGETGTTLTGTGSVSATGLDLGYYFVTSTSGTIANLTTTNPTVTIHDKNDFNFVKTDDKESVAVGETVTYTIKGKVPDTTGYTSYKYEINDTMTDGLTFDNTNLTNLTVTVNGVEDTTNITKTLSGNGFKLEIDVMNLQANVGKEIVVTYTATVNDNAVAKVSYNRAVLTYTQDPVTLTDTTSAEQIATVYSAKIVIDKQDSTDSAIKLEHAKFVLQNSTGNYYKRTSNNVEWVADIGEATVVETDSNGAASFTGLADGTYTLIETAAPDGYNLLETKPTVTVAGDMDETDTNPVTLSSTSTAAEQEASLVDKVVVKNSTGSILPSTGGIGTTIFYIVGGVLVAAAVVLLVAKKRASNNR